MVVYVPFADFYGQDSFTYLVSDGIVTSEGRVTVQVNPVNDAPEFIKPSTDQETDVAEVGLLYIYSLEVSDTDVDDSLTISLEPVTAPSWLTIESIGDRQAELKGTPSQDQIGTYDFVVIVRDSAGAEDRLDFKIEVFASSVTGGGVAAAGDTDTITDENVTNSTSITSTIDASGEGTSD